MPARGNGNQINDPSSMLCNQNADMSLIQGINGEMIELWLEYSGFDPLNGGNTLPFDFDTFIGGRG